MEYINALRSGTHLDEYQVRNVLGQGGFGITYLADDIKLDRVVALKEYLPRDFATRTTGSTVVPNSSADAADYNWGLERFLDEARTLARFDHPHLNKVHRFFEANGTAYLVLEYIDGRPSHLLTFHLRHSFAALSRSAEWLVECSGRLYPPRHIASTSCCEATERGVTRLWRGPASGRRQASSF